jgi:hypothetical protein
LNRRPPGCDPGALPTELWPQHSLLEDLSLLSPARGCRRLGVAEWVKPLCEKFRMGQDIRLLIVGSFDDAIRQHLDLKRRRGASLREVAELEREALGLHADDRPAANDGPSPEAAGRTLRRSQVDQETAEIDMEALIGVEHVEREFYARDNRQAYDWSADSAGADIGDPQSIFEWETPLHGRLRGAA